MTSLLCAPLIACAAAGDPVVHVPADLARPPCRPAAGLMAPPAPLPPIAAGERMVDVAARDAAAFNALRRAMIDLQRHIAEFCAD